MPRHIRTLSMSGYMHIITRGIGQKVIFECETDFNYYLKLLEKYSKECEITIIAYCLMDNHVHLLIKDIHHNTSKFMQKIGISYSYYYNKKYERTGYLFQDRYLNENVENNAYLLTVFRYILNNPLKAHIAASNEYKWNSYYQYSKNDSWVDTSVISNQLGSWDNYVKYIDESNDDKCMEYFHSPKADKWALEQITKCLEGAPANSISTMNKNTRDLHIKKLLSEGLSIRQIERLTGVSRGVIQRIK